MQAIIQDLTFSDNGTGGANTCVSLKGNILFRGCVVFNCRSHALICNSADVCAGEQPVSYLIDECDIYNWGTNGGVSVRGISLADNTNICHTIIHSPYTGVFSTDNIYAVGVSSFYICDTISHSGTNGLFCNNSNGMIAHCNFYDFATDCIHIGNGNVLVKNTNVVKANTHGIHLNRTGDVWNQASIINCGFGTGTYGFGGSHIFQADDNIVFAEVDSVVYPSNTSPWLDADNGDFTLNISQAKQAGRGVFTQNDVGYGGFLSYPDIGAVQSSGNISAPSGGGFYNHALSLSLSGTIDLDSDILKVMLLTTGYVFDTDHTVLNPGVSGSNSLTHNEIGATNYASGFGQTGRQTATITLKPNNVDNTTDVAIANITWTSLGGASNYTVVGAALVKENTSDTDSIPIVYFSFPDTLTNGGDMSLAFATLANGGNVRFYL
jgi:hypothetical protein